MYNTKFLCQPAKYLPMDQLRIVILSKQLKYSLANEKVKTLEKAIQLLPKLTQDQVKTKVIQTLADKNVKIKADVDRKWGKNRAGQRETVGKLEHASDGPGRGGDGLMERTQSLPRNVGKEQAPPFYGFLFEKCICEIYGSKGSGKTSLMLNFAQIYANAYKNDKKGVEIQIYNCMSGLTPSRLQKLTSLQSDNPNVKLQIIEMGNPEQLETHLSTLVLSGSYTMICIDMLTMLLQYKQKPKVILCQIFKTLTKLVLEGGAIVVFTNLVHHKYEIGSEEVYNHSSYNSQYIGDYITEKLFVERPERGRTLFGIHAVKGRVNGTANFTMSEMGVKDLKEVSTI